MNKNNPSRPHFELIFIILFSSSFLASCNKSGMANSETKTIKSEYVCTVTPEQIPEIRGFRLGMSYDDVKRRFPNFCPLSKDDSNRHSIEFYKTTDKNPSSSKNNCWHESLEFHPELEGVAGIEIGFWKGLIHKFLIRYDKTTDEKFDFTFRRTMKETLGLAQFTNWENRADYYDISSWSEAGVRNPRGEQLLCDKLNIAVGMGKDVYEKAPSEYQPFIEIRTTNISAVTKAQAEQERKAAENNDRKKRETFKP